MLKKLFGRKNTENSLEKAYQRAVNEIYFAKKNGQNNLLIHHYDARTTDKMVEMLNGRFVAFKTSIHTISVVIY